jgi:hypothetical protein
MEELAKQIAVLYADMAWVKQIVILLLVAVVGLGFSNAGLTILAILQVRNHRRQPCDTPSSQKGSH